MDYADFVRCASGVRSGLRAVTDAVDGLLPKALTELVKLRVSQLNGCAFCLQFHLDLARHAGVSQAQLDLLPAWREARLFSDRERAALAWAEALTQPLDHESLASSRAALQQHFNPEEVAMLTSAVGVIHAWNRIAVGLGFTPQIKDRA
jgi:AhpD family alkylhydroperoxidase